MSSENKISVILTIEVIGRPKEHLIETLEDIIKKISEERGVTILKKKIREPIEIKDKKDLYTSFTELELEVQEVIVLQSLLFKYMPSHVEILSPEKMTLTNSDLNFLFNDLVMKLHRYDEVARILQIEKVVLEQKLKSILEQLQPKITAREDLEALDKKPEDSVKKEELSPKEETKKKKKK